MTNSNAGRAAVAGCDIGTILASKSTKAFGLLTQVIAQEREDVLLLFACRFVDLHSVESCQAGTDGTRPFG